VNVLVIVAHPEPDAFTHVVARRVADGARAVGHDVVVRDLYAEGFRAAMSAEERVAYHSDRPVLDPLVADHVADLQRAHTLVFVYPTWWSSLPAILKGWFERTMVAGVAFRFDERHHVKPALTNVRRLVGVSTYGSRWPYVKIINDNGRRTIMRALRLSTGLRTRTTWKALYGLDSRTEPERARFLDECEAMARGWR
jgi:putative NADPH-quinone reductase